MDVDLNTEDTQRLLRGNPVDVIRDLAPSYGEKHYGTQELDEASFEQAKEYCEEPVMTPYQYRVKAGIVFIWILLGGGLAVILSLLTKN